ncbi:unnamed protein product [Cuscuta europaea]|uniref:RING-type domain-containing protein n=1 Tax=Cuscuta europaea TaxID=41803 RepID=A0A9P0ZRQ3_CUSEU|nr:unnamed protein product [Cuscuta europaea]
MAENSSSTSVPLRKLSTCSNFAYTGKLTLIIVVVLAVVCLFFAFFRLFLRRTSCHRGLRPDHRRSGVREASGSAISAPIGPDPSLHETLQTFPHLCSSSKWTNNGTPAECSVCLSELRDGETGRVLPGCEHCFHAECIERWFRAHANCPLCRARILLVKSPSHLIHCRAEAIPSAGSQPVNTPPALMDQTMEVSVRIEK